MIKASKPITTNTISSMWYLGASVIVKLLSFMLLPIYSKYLTVSEYGQLATLESLARLLPLLFSLCLESAFYRYYHSNEVDEKRLYSTYILFIFLNGLFLTLGTLLFLDHIIPELKFINHEVVLVSGISAIFAQISILGISEWKLEVKAKYATMFMTVLTISSFIFTLIFLINANFGWESRVFGYGLGILVQFIVVLFFLMRKRNVLAKPSLRLLTFGLKFSLPLFPGVIGTWLLALFDRLYMQSLGLDKEVGVYSLGVQLAMVLYLLQDSIFQVNSATVMKQLNNGRMVIKEQSVFISKTHARLLFVFVALSFFYYEVFLLFFTKEYFSALMIIPIIMFAHLLRGWYRFYTVFLSFHKKTKVLGIASIIQIVFVFVINYYYIPIYGGISAAFSLVISSLLMVLFLSFYCKKIVEFDIDWIRIAVSSCACVSLVAIYYMYIFKGDALYSFEETIIKVVILIFLYIGYLRFYSKG